MKERFLSILGSVELLDQIRKDFTQTFSYFEKDNFLCTEYAENIVRIYLENRNKDIFYIEQKIHSFLMSIQNYNQSFLELNEKRSKRIFSEIGPYLEKDKSVLDFGCGNGGATNLFSKEGFSVSGCDVVKYLVENISFPYYYFDGKSIPVQESFFYQGWANSVLHHDEDPEKVIQEISRVVSNRFILIEDVLCSHLKHGVDFHKERLFANDYFYNRLLTFEEIPVPGTFKTKESWISLFANFGWKLESEKDLGQSTFLPAVYRQMMVFTK